MQIIDDIFVFLQNNPLATLSLLISIFVAYKNYIKPFKLHIRHVNKIIFWTKGDCLRADIIFSLYNSGIREGVIENLSFNVPFAKHNAIFEAEYYYKLSKDEKLELEDFWVPVFLKGKESLTKTIGFKSDIRTENANDVNTSIDVIINYKKNLSSKRTKILKIAIPVSVNIAEAVKCGPSAISN